MAIFVFENEGLPGIQVRVSAQEDHVAREELEAYILEAAYWLTMETVHKWRKVSEEW